MDRCDAYCSLTSMTESRKAQWQCASTTRLECHVRMRGCEYAELSYRDSRCLLIPVGKPLSCGIREKGRERKREGGKKREREREEFAAARARVRIANGFRARLFRLSCANIARALPMINLFSFGKRARPLEQCYWPICRAIRGINCCFRYVGCLWPWPRRRDMHYFQAVGHYFTTLMFHSLCPVHSSRIYTDI